MTADARIPITQMLRDVRSADRSAAAASRDRLYSAIYPELKKVAAALMRSERAGHVLQPTALVHEAYLKLLGAEPADWQSRAHFLGTATRAMRQVLVDQARQRNAAKRGAGAERVTLGEEIASETRTLGILEVDDAISRLSRLSERMAQVVEMRVFGGMSHEEIAEALGVSLRTSVEDWSVARRWLAREFSTKH
jgi:RNA polymerase sigma factor (TIGR02999 family)